MTRPRKHRKIVNGWQNNKKGQDGFDSWISIGRNALLAEGPESASNKLSNKSGKIFDSLWEIEKARRAAAEMAIDLLQAWKQEEKDDSSKLSSEGRGQAYGFAVQHALSLSKMSSQTDFENVPKLNEERKKQIDTHLGHYHSKKLRGIGLILSGTLCLIAVGLIIAASHGGALAALPLLKPMVSYAAMAIGTGTALYAPGVAMGLGFDGSHWIWWGLCFEAKRCLAVFRK